MQCAHACVFLKTNHDSEELQQRFTYIPSYYNKCAAVQISDSEVFALRWSDSVRLLAHAKRRRVLQTCLYSYIQFNVYFLCLLDLYISMIFSLIIRIVDNKVLSTSVVVLEFRSAHAAEIWQTTVWLNAFKRRRMQGCITLVL